ncbi:MAG TPA: carboxypeptidase regulatory-like domain-containing protein, partial [Candidatus Ozemobacteraceae bacterium]|nr:carboxypeptidase regulatory-like domain-containing protein [Candidatus Ozemobacteraceae bacterium]
PVDQVVNLGIMTGFPDGRFQPHKPMTRGEATVIFSRLIQALEKAFFRKPPILPIRPKYADVPDGHWLNGDLARIGGVGGLRCFPGERFRANDSLRLIELRQLRTALLDYFGENLFILSGTPPELLLLPKGVFQRLTCQDWSYSMDQVEWTDVPPNGRIKLPEGGSPTRLWLKNPDFQTIGPVEVRSDQLNFWLLLVRKDLRKFRDRLLAERNKEFETDGSDRLGFHLQSLRARLKKPDETPAPPKRDDAETIVTLMEGMHAEEGSGEETVATALPPTAQTADNPIISDEQRTIQPKWGGGPEIELADGTRGTAKDSAPPRVLAGNAVETRTRHFSREIPDPMSFTGNVIDSLTGKGVAGAVVLADKQTGETDERGVFRFKVSPGAMLDLTIYREGYEPLSLRQRVDRQSPESRFQLKPLFADFGGFVTSEDTGEPIAGAVIRLGEQRARSGPDGRYRFTRVRPTFYQLSGQAEGFMEAVEFVHVSPTREQPHELKLKPVEQAWQRREAPEAQGDGSINEARIDAVSSLPPIE